MIKKQQATLLDELAQRMGCAYLSDLHRHFGSMEFCTCVESIPCGIYPLEQWQETVEYLLLQRSPACTDEAAARLLLTQDMGNTVHSLADIPKNR